MLISEKIHKKKMLEKVKDFNNTIPKGDFGLSGFKWGSLLVFDYTFGLSLKKNDNGKIMRKLENPGFIGKKFRFAHKKCIAKLKENNTEEFKETFPIPSIEASDFTKEFFEYWNSKIKHPLVIKGFLKDAPILIEAEKDFLVKNRGDLEVQSLPLNQKDESKLGQNIDVVKSSLKDYLTLMEFESHYLNNFHGILDDKDFNDKCKGDLLDNILGQKNFLTQWFISRSSKVGSSLHCAGAVNMFLNIKGRKQWNFVHPSYSPVLQSTVSKYGAFAVSEMFENFKSDPHQEIIENYQDMRFIPFYRCVLEEGDVLYNPEYWWHSVRNITDYTVGCATRYGASKITFSAIVWCMIVDMIKHPRKSSTIQVMKIMKGKESKKIFNDIIFTKSEKEGNPDN